MSNEDRDIYWMTHALQLAEHAAKQGEVPIGAVLVLNDEKIAEGWNQPIASCDPTAHAEVIALRQAAKQLNNYRLVNTTLYVTLEPCAMCAGAMIQARVGRLVFGALDPRAGAVESVFNILQTTELNHRVSHQRGILAEECGALLKTFFKARR